MPDAAVTIADRINQKYHHDWIQAFLVSHREVRSENQYREARSAEQNLEVRSENQCREVRSAEQNQGVST